MATNSTTNNTTMGDSIHAITPTLVAKEERKKRKAKEKDEDGLAKERAQRVAEEKSDIELQEAIAKWISGPRANNVSRCGSESITTEMPNLIERAIVRMFLKEAVDNGCYISARKALCPTIPMTQNITRLLDELDDYDGDKIGFKFWRPITDEDDEKPEEGETKTGASESDIAKDKRILEENVRFKSMGYLEIEWDDAPDDLIKDYDPATESLLSKSFAALSLSGYGRFG